MNYFEYLIETQQYNEIELEIPDFQYFLSTIQNAFLKNGYIIIEIKEVALGLYSFKYISMVSYKIEPEKLFGNKYDKLIKDLKEILKGRDN